MAYPSITTPWRRALRPWFASSLSMLTKPFAPISSESSGTNIVQGKAADTDRNALPTVITRGSIHLVPIQSHNGLSPCRRDDGNLVQGDSPLDGRSYVFGALNTKTTTIAVPKSDKNFEPGPVARTSLASAVAWSLGMLPEKSIILSTSVGRESRQISSREVILICRLGGPVWWQGSTCRTPSPPASTTTTTLRPLQNRPWSPGPQGLATAPEPSANRCLQKKRVYTLKSQLLFCWDFNMLPESHENTKIKSSMWRTLVFWCLGVSTRFQRGCSSMGRHLQHLALVPLSHSGTMWKAETARCK